MGRKSPLFALFLSFLIPGLGQIYNGQIIKGILFIIAYIVVWGSILGVYFAGAAVTMGAGLICCLPVFIIPLIIWVYTMMDALKTARMINRHYEMRDWFRK